MVVIWKNHQLFGETKFTNETLYEKIWTHEFKTLLLLWCAASRRDAARLKQANAFEGADRTHLPVT